MRSPAAALPAPQTPAASASAPGSFLAASPGAASVASPGAASAASPGAASVASPGAASVASAGTAFAASPGAASAASPGVLSATAPGVAAAPSRAPLATAGLTVRYGRRTVLAGVSLELRAGKVYALLGRNGAGKSSLVRCLLGQQRPAAGSARLLGRDAWHQRASLMAEVGVVLEQPDAPPGSSARRLAAFCRPLYRAWDGRGFEERLRRFAVPADVPFGKLSKGQQRQVALALALAPGPRLLILDDPTLGLDAVARRAFFDELIGELADRGTTVFLTTHELAAVERIADRVGILAGGRLVLDEELERLRERCRRLRLPPGPAAAAAGGGPPEAPAGFTVLHREARAWGTDLVVTDFDDERFGAWRAGLAPILHRAGGGGQPVEVAALSLEEIFVIVAGPAGGAASAGGSGGAGAAAGADCAGGADPGVTAAAAGAGVTGATRAIDSTGSIGSGASGTSIGSDGSGVVRAGEDEKGGGA